MAKFFTPGTTPPGFYVSRPNIECVEITDERWNELLIAQFSGKQIIADSDGTPVAVDIVSTPQNETHSN